MCSLVLQNYLLQSKEWPPSGRHIMAQYNDNTVVVYQAFCPEIADYAVKHQRFGGSKYSTNRMTWIKPNFLWMMYRSGWGTKANQERILAIHVSLEGFEKILGCAFTAKQQKLENINSEDITVRLQWDPDHDPYGEKVVRRAIQLGLKNKTLECFNDCWIKKIEDITEFVKEQHSHVLAKDLTNLSIPKEKVYVPSSSNKNPSLNLD